MPTPEAMYNGLAIVRTFFVHPGQIMVIGNSVLIHPWWDLRTGIYRPPGWTRCMLGVKEAERDRRRYPKATLSS